VVRSKVDNQLDSTVIIDLLTWTLVCFGEHVFGVIMLASRSIVVFCRSVLVESGQFSFFFILTRDK
jgi:hypothetical protein